MLWLGRHDIHYNDPQHNSTPYRVSLCSVASWWVSIDLLIVMLNVIRPLFTLVLFSSITHAMSSKGGSITVPLASCLTGLETAVWQLTIFIYLQNRLLRTSQTEGQWHSDTSPFSIPWSEYWAFHACLIHLGRHNRNWNDPNWQGKKGRRNGVII